MLVSQILYDAAKQRGAQFTLVLVDGRRIEAISQVTAEAALVASGVGGRAAGRRVAEARIQFALPSR